VPEVRDARMMTSPEARRQYPVHVKHQKNPHNVNDFLTLQLSIYAPWPFHGFRLAHAYFFHEVS
jgi:hypothetical protein